MRTTAAFAFCWIEEFSTLSEFNPPSMKWRGCEAAREFIRAVSCGCCNRDCALWEFGNALKLFYTSETDLVDTM